MKICICRGTQIFLSNNNAQFQNFFSSTTLFTEGTSSIFLPHKLYSNKDQSIYASSFYRSQNVLCRSKFFQPAQKFDCIQCLFKNFCAGTKTNFTECKSSFCLAQNVCDCHNMKINFWSGTKNLDHPKTFWDLQKDNAIKIL